MQLAEALDISFRAGTVAWLQQDWEDRVQWSPWQFVHLTVGWLDPDDWIITKLGRWQRHDFDDAVAVAKFLDVSTLHHYVQDGLNDYIGNPVRAKQAWNDLVEAMGWSSAFEL